MAKKDLDLRKVELDGGVMTYDADMRMGDLRKLLASGQSGDLEAIVDAFTGIIHSWPYKGDPQDAEAWDDLRRSEFMALTEAMMEDLQLLGEA